MVNYVYNVKKLFLNPNVYNGKTTIVNVDLSNVPFTGNSMSESFNANSYVSKLKNVYNINDDVKVMQQTFYNCQNLISVSALPSNIQSLSYTFENCIRLVNAPTIPNSVTDMYCTFIECTQLKNVPSIPNSVINMYSTFARCDNLVTAPNIGSGVVNMNRTFHSCAKLTGNIYINSDNVNHFILERRGSPSDPEVRYWTPFNNTTLVKNVYIPYRYENGEWSQTYNAFFNINGWSNYINQYTPIGTATVKQNGLNGVTCFDSRLHAEIIDDWSYYNGKLGDYVGSQIDAELPYVESFCPDINMGTIENINFNSSYNDVNLYKVFRNCKNIHTVADIPENTTNLVSAFENCYSLYSVTSLPENITDITRTFYGCNNLTDLPIINWNNISNMSYAFYNCESLMYIPTINWNNVSNMDYAFNGCTNLLNVSDVTISNKITSLSSTFARCYKLEVAPVIPDSVTSLHTTFGFCPLIEPPEIPNSVISLSYTFWGCNQLINAPEIPNSVISMSGTFNSCESLTDAPTIPDSVTEMSATFSSCSQLINAPVIPNSVINISNAFRNCSLLETIPALSNNIINMSNAFYGCNRLTSIPNIPNTVINMSHTFDGCRSLEGDIYIFSENVNFAYYCFDNTSLSKNVYIPYNYKEDVTPMYGWNCLHIGTIGRTGNYYEWLFTHEETLTSDTVFYLKNGVEYTGHDLYIIDENTFRLDFQENIFYEWDRHNNYDISNNTRTPTYNAFNNAGYITHIQNGVHLKDLNDLE